MGQAGEGSGEKKCQQQGSAVLGVLPDGPWVVCSQQMGRYYWHGSFRAGSAIRADHMAGIDGNVCLLSFATWLLWLLLRNATQNTAGQLVGAVGSFFSLYVFLTVCTSV